jgi:hypothetical protein
MVMTNAQRQARARAKKKMIAAEAAAAVMYRGPGGVDRLSVLVEARVKAMVEAGLLVPSIRDGLSAAKINEAREARTDTKQLAITLAMLLSGASGDGPPERLLIDDGMIFDGEAEEMDDE